MDNTTELVFTKNKKGWQASFVSEGDCVVEVERTGQGMLQVHANLEGMKQVLVAELGPNNENMIFEVAVPEGVEVTITSRAEVISAKLLSE